MRASKLQTGLIAGILFGLLGSLPGGALAQSSIPGCDIRVERYLARASIERIDRETELARAFYRDLPEGGFRTLSCLDRLLGSGVNVIFAPPDLGAILSAIESRVCGIAQQHVNRAIQPLSRSLQAGVDLDGMLPGIGLGRLTAGIAVSPHGGGGQPLINIVNARAVSTPTLRSNGIFGR